jgi:hypothetical protein
MATNKDRQGASYERDSSSDTEDYHDVDETRRRVFKSRLRYKTQHNFNYYYFGINVSITQLRQQLKTKTMPGAKVEHDRE